MTQVLVADDALSKTCLQRLLAMQAVPACSAFASSRRRASWSRMWHMLAMLATRCRRARMLICFHDPPAQVNVGNDVTCTVRLDMVDAFGRTATDTNTFQVSSLMDGS